MSFLSVYSRIDMIVPVWGTAYTQLFLNYLLPSLLASGNLPAWPYCGHTFLQIATQKEDAQIMEDSPIFQKIRAYLPVQMNIFEPEQFEKLSNVTFNRAKFFILQTIMAEMLKRSMLASAHVIPLMADTLLANNFLTYLAQVFEQKPVLLMMAGPRLALASQKTIEMGRTENALELSPQMLNQLLFSNPHPHEQACFLDAPLFSAWPSHVYYWKTPQELYSHWFHMHPFFLYHPQIGQNQWGISIDGDILAQYDDRRSNIRLVQKSETMACSVTNAFSDIDIRLKELTLARRQQMLIKFGQEKCLPIQRWFFSHPISFFMPEIKESLPI
jgi:hypothetical protein